MLGLFSNSPFIPPYFLPVPALLESVAALEQAENAASKGWSLGGFSKQKIFCNSEAVEVESCFGERREERLQKKKPDEPLGFSWY